MGSFSPGGQAVQQAALCPLHPEEGPGEGSHGWSKWEEGGWVMGAERQAGDRLRGQRRGKGK